MANQTLAKSSQLRNSVSNLVAQSATDQSQLIARLIRTRMNIEAAQKAAPSKWYR